MEKLKKVAARGFYFASNRKSLPTIVLKTQESCYAGDNVSVDTCSTFLGNIMKIRPFLALTPRLYYTYDSSGLCYLSASMR